MRSDIQALAATTQQLQEIIQWIANQLDKLNEGAKRGKIHLETTFSSYMSFIDLLIQIKFAAGF